MSPLLRSLRPRHWIKNFVVFAGLGFSGRALETALWGPVLALFAAFCLAASGVYLGNDVLDRERDRLHPVKRHRPVAAGLVSVATAVALASALIAAALALAWLACGWRSGAALAGYLGLQAAYSFRLKHVVILDVFCIAAGFLLRVLAGVWAIDEQVSPWLVACAVELALFLALCKRRAESAALAPAASTAQRPALDDYRGAAVDIMISVVASSAVVTYALSTLLPGIRGPTARDEPGPHAGLPGMVWTLPIALYGILRYLYLVYRQEKGERPEVTVMTDGPLVAAALLYLAVAGLVIYGDRVGLR